MNQAIDVLMQEHRFQATLDPAADNGSVWRGFHAERCLLNQALADELEQYIGQHRPDHLIRRNPECFPHGFLDFVYGFAFRSQFVNPGLDLVQDVGLKGIVFP